MFLIAFAVVTLEPWLFVAADRPAQPANLAVVTVASSSERKEALCDADIVRDTCDRLNRDPQEKVRFFGDVADRDRSVLHAAELAEMLMVSRSSVQGFLSTLAIQNVDTNLEAREHSAYAVKCMELCTKTVASLPAEGKPIHPDLACVPGPGGTIDCTLDVSPSTLSTITVADHSEDEAEEEFTETSQGLRKKEDDLVAHSHHHDWNAQDAARQLEALEGKNYKDAGIDELRTRICNLFRVFPLIKVDAVENDDSVSEKDGSEDLLALDSQARLSSSTQAGQLNLVQLEAGGDCGEAVQFGVSRSFSFGRSLVSKLECKCPRGMNLAGESNSCTSSGEMYLYSSEELAGKGCSCRHPQFADGCMDDDSGKCAEPACHMPEVQDACPKACKIDCGAVKMKKNWEKEVIRRAVEGQAYIANALRLMGRREIPQVVEKWFGKNEESTRTEIRRVLNGLSAMLMNVEFRYPGNDCGAFSRAYVFPDWPWRKNMVGQYVVYLCDTYMDNPEKQIAVLLHEGSHHKPMATKDICTADGGEDCEHGGKAYGKTPSLHLAQEFPGSALRNADNYVYFISEIER